MFELFVKDTLLIMGFGLLFSLCGWVAAVCLQLTAGLLNTFMPCALFSWLEGLLGNFKVIPALLFLCLIPAAAIGFGLNWLMGGWIDAKIESHYLPGDMQGDASPAKETAPSLASLPRTFTNSLGMGFVLVPPGSYPLNGDKIEKKNEFGETVSSIAPAMRVTQPYYISRDPVTQEQWVKLMNENPVAEHKRGRHKPVDKVSWFEAVDFISRLNGSEKNRQYSLPTEAQWNNAFQWAALQKGFHNISKIPWEAPNMGDRENPDEWCADRFGELPKERETRDYKGAVSGVLRVVNSGFQRRSGKVPGGGFLDHKKDYDNIGFRLVYNPGGQ